MMIMFKFNCQANTVASGFVIFQQGSNMIALAMHLFFQQFSVVQASSYPCVVQFLVDWHMF